MVLGGIKETEAVTIEPTNDRTKTIGTIETVLEVRRVPEVVHLLQATAGIPLQHSQQRILGDRKMMEPILELQKTILVEGINDLIMIEETEAEIESVTEGIEEKEIKGMDSEKMDLKNVNIENGSEMNSSGSDKSFQKGPRTSSRNDHRGGNFRDKTNNSFTSPITEDSWNVSALTAPIDAALSTAVFEQLNVVGTEAAVMISWFHNPTYFYCQLQSAQSEFRTLMEEIQEFYKNRKPETAVVGAPIIGLFPEDNVLYRAKVLELAGGNYKVLYVDFGNIATITKVWPIEKKFMVMPAQAICSGMDGIAPTGESWPEPSSFGKFFQKETYMARFLYELDSRTYIELWDGQDNVARRLVEENLAIPLAPTSQQTSEVDIAFLLGQQFRVILKSVNNLSDIIVALENGLALNCKMHNLDLAEETFEDVLKACLEQVLIVYVDNILEGNILEVTFYDNEGNKLVVLNPDEGALDNVESLCPILILNSYLTGFVAHAGEKAIYVQPNEHADAIANLLEKMFEAYENEQQDTPIIPEEDMLYAIHSPDTNWYRGRCLSLDDTSVTVIYVDYGNTETVPFTELRELKTEFLVPHMLCVQVTLTSGSPQDYLEKDVVATIYFGDSGWEGVCEVSGDIAAMADVTETQQTTLTETVPEVSDQNAVIEQVEALQEAIIDQVSDNAAAVITQELDSTKTPVYVSHIDSPSQFYVQFEASIPALDELQANIQSTVNEWPVLEKVSVGVFCAAPFSVDQQWYRAEVLDYDDDITTVRFVDFGNTDVISNDSTQVKTLPASLLSLALYATRCSLKLKPIDEEWSQAAIEFFESYANAEKVEAEFIIQDEKSNYIDLYANGQNIRELLIKENHAQPCEIVTESKPTCFISHLNSPSEFWVQMETCVGELEWIAEQLSVAETFPELDDTSPGTLCAALFPDDEMWYRARILSHTIAGIELLFIDYGNSCISASLRQLPEDLLVTSPLAQKCCLQKPEGIPYWTPEARNKFSELSAEGQTIFTIRKITTEETAVVELLLNEESVVPMILPVTQGGYAKNVEDMSKFNIETNSEVSVGLYGLEPMPGMIWNDESLQKFKELYPEGTLFEIECVSENTVRLYINGSDIRPNLGGDKVANLSNNQADIEDVVIKTEILDTPVETESQNCDTNDTEIHEIAENVVVDLTDFSEPNITPDSGRHSEVSEEALVEEPSSKVVQTSSVEPIGESNVIVDPVVSQESGKIEENLSEKVEAQGDSEETSNEVTATVEGTQTTETGVTSSSSTAVKTTEIEVTASDSTVAEPVGVTTLESTAVETTENGVTASISTVVETTENKVSVSNSTAAETSGIGVTTSESIARDTPQPEVTASVPTAVEEKEIEVTASESKVVDTTEAKVSTSNSTAVEMTPTETAIDVEATQTEAAASEDTGVVTTQTESDKTSMGTDKKTAGDIMSNNVVAENAEHSADMVWESAVKAAAMASSELDLEVQNVVNKNGNANNKVQELKNGENVEKPVSRPSSRLSFDERILPAVVSRPQSPIPLSPDGTT